jgi:hypothetical protein
MSSPDTKPSSMADLATHMDQLRGTPTNDSATDTSSTSQEPPTSGRRLSRRRFFAATLGTIVVGSLGAAAIAKASSPDSRGITIAYDQVSTKPHQKEEDGSGPFVQATIFAPDNLNVSHGTVTTVSETTRRYPGSENQELKTVTDVANATLPGEPYVPLNIVEVPEELDSTDFGGRVDLRSGKNITVTIFERAGEGLEKGKILAQKNDIVPTEFPSTSR